MPELIDFLIGPPFDCPIILIRLYRATVGGLPGEPPKLSNIYDFRNVFEMFSFPFEFVEINREIIKNIREH